MIDVSGGQLQSLYPASHHRTVVGHGGYPPPECLASSSSESAVSSSSSSSSFSSGCAQSKSIRQEETVTVRSAGAVPSTTAVTMLGCAHSSGQETPPPKILSFPFQKDAESSQKDLAGCWSHDALLTQRHSGASCSLQSPLQSKKQQEVDACGQMSLSRCLPHSDIPLSSDRLCTAVSSPSNTVLPSLTATSVAPSALLSSSSCTPPQQEPDKHSSPNPHQVLSSNRHFLHSQLHHGQQLFQQQPHQNQSCVLQPHDFRPGSTTTTTTSNSSVASPGVGTTEDFSPRAMLTCTTTSTTTTTTITTTTNNNSSSNNVNVSRYSSSSGGGGDSGHSSEEDEECYGYNRQSMDYITDKLQHQMVLDGANPLLRSQRQQQESSAEDRFSLPLRPSASVTNTGADSVKSQISLSKSSGLNTTLQGLLSLNIEDSSRKVYPRTLFPSDTCTNQNLSLPAALHSQSASSSSPLISEGLVPTTHGYGTSLPSNTSSKICEDIILPITAGEGAGHATASDVSSDNNENLKDTSPGTPPYPPKKKHCRSLSIPSENSWNISSRLCYKARGDVPTMVTLSNNNNNNHQNYSAPLELSSRNFGSLLKPAAFQLVTEGNNWGRQCPQNFTSVAEGGERGAGRTGTVVELSGISSSASFPSLQNSNNSTSLPGAAPSHWPTTMMDQPPPPLSSSSSSSCDVRLNAFSSDILNSTTTTTITTSTTVKPTQFKALGPAPPPQPLFQTQHTPPHSPVPRAASVSILGHCDESIDEELDAGRAFSFKPVCWTSQGYNSDFSSPSSCSPSSSSSSSFLLRLQPPPNTTTPTGSLSFPPSSFSSFSSFLTTTTNTTVAAAAHTIPTLSKSYLAAPLTITTADASSSSLSSSPSSSSSPIKMAAGGSVPPQTPFWSFQKHRSFSLEDKCSSSSSTPTPTTATFIGHSTSPLSSLSSTFTSPPATHHPTPPPPQSFSSHHPHHYPHSTRQQAPTPSPPTNTMIPPHVTPPHTQQYLLPPNQHHHLHHQQHHQYHQQQQTQLQQQQQLVTCSGSTPSVPAACKTSMSNPSSPRRHRIPRCRSQPCVLHDRKTGVKRRRDYDRPTLDFHKMTQTAYGSPTCQTEANEQTSQNLYQGPNTTVKYSQFSEDQTQTVKWDRNVLMSTSMPASSMEVLRSASLLPDTHSNDDAMSEDAEISAATEAAEAAAIAAAVAAKNSEQFFPNISPQSIIGQHIDDSDSSCTPWEDSCFQRSFISSAPQSVGSAAGWGDPCVYISDESNPSFCGCDADDVEEITENEDFYSRNKPPIADLDLDQIENH